MQCFSKLKHRKDSKLKR